MDDDLIFQLTGEGRGNAQLISGSIGDLLTGRVLARGIKGDVDVLRKAAGNLNSFQLAILSRSIRKGLQEFAARYRLRTVNYAKTGIRIPGKPISVLPGCADAELLMEFIEEPADVRAEYRLAQVIKPHENRLEVLFSSLGLTEALLGMAKELKMSASCASKFLQDRPKDYLRHAGPHAAKIVKEKIDTIKDLVAEEFWRLSQELGWDLSDISGRKAGLARLFIGQAKLSPGKFLHEEVVRYILDHGEKTVKDSIWPPPKKKGSK